MDISIVFEDDSLLVIEKPSGLVVNRSDTTAKVETLEDWAATKIKDVERSGIVHRLDKDTSGLLVIAKTSEAFENLKSQFKNRETVKKYLALVHGKVEPLEGTINAPIERNPFNRKHFGVFPGGREAVTGYKTIGHSGARRAIESNNKDAIASLQHDEFTLLEITPKTGRTHQIRVHMKYINHPIVSDPIYGGRKNYQNDLKWCPRLFLHATYLKINNMEFNSPLAPDLQTALDNLQ